MDFDDTTSDTEDETDYCTLQYQEADPSLLGTAVFIKTVQIDPGDRVLIYKHNADEEAEQRDDKSIKPSLSTIVVLSALVTLSFYSFL